MACIFQPSFLSPVQYSPKNKSKTENDMPSWMRASLGSTVMRAIGPQNAIKIDRSNVSIWSQDVRQQTSTGPATSKMYSGCDWDDLQDPGTANGNGGYGSNGRGRGGGGGGYGEGRGGDRGDFDEEEFWPFLNFADVRRKASEEAAKAERIRSDFFRRYFDFHMGLLWPLCYLMSSSTIRNGMLDLFKIVTEKCGNFWSGFKTFTPDSLIGMIFDIALVGTLATSARMWPMPSVPGRFFWQLQLAFASLASRKLALWLFQMATDFNGTKKSEKDTPVSDMVKSAALCGVFLAVQSSPLAKQVSSVALAYTVGTGFAKIIFGGLQLADWAKWSVSSCTLLLGFLLFLL